MKTRYLLGVVAVSLAAGAANAQYIPATYQEPYCREFTKVVDVGGRPQPAYGKACYKPDGSWEIVSDDISSDQPVEYVPASNQVVYPTYPTYTPYPTAYQPYYSRPASAFSISFSNWSSSSRHGWRDRGWDRGRNGNHERGRGRGNGRHH